MHNLCWINDNIPNSQMRPEILQQMLQTVLNIIMFEDCRLTLPRISLNSGLYQTCCQEPMEHEPALAGPYPPQ